MEKTKNDSTNESGFVMREHEIDTSNGKARIRYLVCKPMEEAGFINAFSTREGGISPLPENALNLAHFKGDDKQNVNENRRRFLQAIGATTSTIITARQTHSTERFMVEDIEQARGPQPDCDAMTTDIAQALLAIQTADCLPVLIADPVTGAMAAVHAGWRGTAGRITERTIADLMMLHGMDARDAIAALGPAACVECYEVGEDVISRYRESFGYWKKLFANFKENGKAHLDVRRANIQQLLFCGFTEDRIHAADYCTMHQTDLFFSYRREAKGQPSKVGRLLSVIGKKGE